MMFIITHNSASVGLLFSVTLHVTILNWNGRLADAVSDSWKMFWWSIKCWHNLGTNVILLTLEVACSVSSVIGTLPVTMTGIPPWLTAAVLPTFTFAWFVSIQPQTIDTDSPLIGW
jgi:hypothetical protein